MGGRRGEQATSWRGEEEKKPRSCPGRGGLPCSSDASSIYLKLLDMTILWLEVALAEVNPCVLLLY